MAGASMLAFEILGGLFILLLFGPALTGGEITSR
jgi:hypothetical protein